MPITRRHFLSGAAAITAATSLARPAFAAPDDEPRANGTKRWRLGYVETMPYVNYSATLEGIVRSLGRRGWIKDPKGLPYTAGQTDTKGMWDWLAHADLGPNLEFVADAHYGDLDRLAPDPIINRLKGGDLDLVIVMGTIAGQKIATDAHHVPTLVFSTSNAVAAKIVVSETDSGHDHIWAHMDLKRYARQLRLFYDTFHFKRLGIAYDYSPSGQAIASIPDIEAAAKQYGFSLVRRNVRPPAGADDTERYYADVRQAWQELATGSDAVYITYGRWQLDRFAGLVKPFQEHQVPTFSQLGPEEVERGALMSVARVDFLGIGDFGAGTIARVLDGAKPRSLPQVYFDTPTIAWNLAVARQIKFAVPFTGLLAADQIFTRIASNEVTK